MKLKACLFSLFVLTACTPVAKDWHIRQGCQERVIKGTETPEDAAWVYKTCIEQGNNMQGDYWYKKLKECHTDTECEEAYRKVYYEKFNN